MSGLGSVLKLLGWLTYAVSGVWGLFIALGIVYDIGGTLLVLVGFFLFPVTFVAVPWYAGFGLGWWFPLILNYGGWILGGALWIIGSKLRGEAPE